MTNAIILPLEADMELVITADNSGSIGEKEADIIKTTNEVVGQFACRVALMECLAEYAEPRAVIMQNFTDDAAWFDYEKGIREVLAEVGAADLPITGSTESNFPSLQSGLGLTIVGTRNKRKPYRWTGKESFAVIGTPFVGEAVLKNREQIPSPSFLRKFTENTGVKAVLPIGSKGILNAFQRWTQQKVNLECSVDLKVSAGPSTCFIIAFEAENLERISKLGGELFHLVKL